MTLSPTVSSKLAFRGLSTWTHMRRRHDGLRHIHMLLMLHTLDAALFELTLVP